MKAYTLFTEQGVTFEQEGRSIAHALKRSALLSKEFTVVAIVETSLCIQPKAGKLTALIVQPAKGILPV